MNKIILHIDMNSYFAAKRILFTEHLAHSRKKIPAAVVATPQKSLVFTATSALFLVGKKSV